MTGLSDSFQRPINYLRISVTDRCNLRCIYCMPPEGIVQMSHYDILSYEEIFTLVKAAAELGINRVRLTGGEPLVRAGLSELVRMIASIDTIDDLSLTTNGILLAKYAADLKDAGLMRVNVSLDTLKPERFRQITRCGELADTLKGIEAANEVDLTPVKINMVVMAGINDDELPDFARKTIEDGWNMLLDLSAPGAIERLRRFHPKRPRRNVFGDGHAAEKIVKIFDNEEKQLR